VLASLGSFLTPFAYKFNAKPMNIFDLLLVSNQSKKHIGGKKLAPADQ